MSNDKEANEPKIPIERVQTGFRLEKRMVKVLRATADYLDKSPGNCWRRSFCTLSMAQTRSFHRHARRYRSQTVLRHGLRRARQPSVRGKSDNGKGQANGITHNLC